MECPLCYDNKKFLIKRYNYWTIALHSSQFYLGRCIIKLNRHITDLFETEKEEQEELFEIVPRLKNALNEIFKPDLFNYAALGNIIPHLHFHVIPRYEQKRTFEGIEFIDGRWGENYVPYNRDFNIPDAVFSKIRETIKERISNH